MTTEERFWAKVDIRGDDECWPWLASKQKGYGQMVIVERTKTPQKAHRLAWEFCYGKPPPRDRLVLHRCDKPDCVNPKHLFLGTSKDNSLDAARKGRLVRKLTEDQVREIRKRASCGMPLLRISRELGVGEMAVRKVALGITWTWLP